MVSPHLAETDMDRSINDRGAPTNALSVTREELEDCIVIRVSGEVDVTTSDHLLEALAPDGGRSFVVDLSGMTFINSSGFNALVTARKQGAAITLRHPSPIVRSTLTVTGLDDAFVVDDA